MPAQQDGTQHAHPSHSSKGAFGAGRRTPFRLVASLLAATALGGVSFTIHAPALAATANAPATNAAATVTVTVKKGGTLENTIVSAGAARDDAAEAARAIAKQFDPRTLQPGQVIDGARLERAVLVLGDQPGLRVTPVLRPGQAVAVQER